MNKKYTVFVSSTYEDLKQERQEVMQALLEMDCIPCGMELFPASDEEQFDFIKSIIDDCDYYVLILGGRYGSMSSNGFSYTELEYRYALEHNIPIISFIHGDVGAISNSKCEHDENTIKKLNNFRELAKKRLCKFWTNKEQLAGLVSRSMIQLMKRHPAIGWVRANQISNEESLIKITQLYEENFKLKKSTERSGFDSENNVRTKTLAEGKECLDVVFALYEKANYNSINFSMKMTWDDILKQVGPILIEESTRYDIKKLLNEFATQRYIAQLNNDAEINNFKESKKIEILDQSIGAILIQLMALKYITVQHPNHNNDYALSDQSTYVLTDLGLSVVFNLSAKYID